MKLLARFIALAAFVLVAYAQINATCHAYVPALRGTPHHCDEVLSNNTLVHFYGSATTQEEALLIVDGELFNGLIDLTSPECRASAVSFACLAAFQICDSTAPLGYRIPCKSQCESVGVHCDPYFSLVASAKAPDCNNETISVEDCNATVVTISAVKCKAPLLFDGLADASKGEPSCWKCPPPVFRQKTLNMAWIFKIVSGGLSMLVMGFSLVVFATNPKYRRFQTHLFIIISMDSFFLGLGLFMIGVAPSKILCENEARDAQPWHFLCTLQGSIFLFFGVQIITAWMILSLNLVYIIYRGVRFMGGKFPLAYKITMYIILWGLPTLQWVIAMAFSSIKPFVGFTTCFVTNDNLFQWGIFFGWPLIPITVVGLSCFSYVLYRLTKGPKFAKGTNARKDEAKRLVVGFMIVYLIMSLYILLWRISNDFMNAAQTKNVENMLKCLLQVGGEGCINDLLNVPALMILYICAFANGIPVFIVWVSSRAYRVAVLQLFGLEDIVFTRAQSKTSAKSGNIITATSADRSRAPEEALSIRSELSPMCSPRESSTSDSKKEPDEGAEVKTAEEEHQMVDP